LSIQDSPSKRLIQDINNVDEEIDIVLRVLRQQACSLKECMRLFKVERSFERSALATSSKKKDLYVKVLERGEARVQNKISHFEELKRVAEDLREMVYSFL